ncbi:MAG TPA: regulatory protein RecX [Bacteroidales bacterium]|nr:regulatory protein RecX [Bacteroidales bacterium]
MLNYHRSEPLDAAQAFRKAADYCAAQERCLDEMRIKLRQWGVSDTLIQTTLEKLTNEGFIDEQRFATAFARGKFRLLEWGKVKIAMELKARKIPLALINKALDEIEETDYRDTIKSLLFKRFHGKNNPSREEIMKTTNFLIGKGFEIEIIKNILKENF